MLVLTVCCCRPLATDFARDVLFVAFYSRPLELTTVGGRECCFYQGAVTAVATLEKPSS